MNKCGCGCDRSPMTVRELIKELTALPEDQKDFTVMCLCEAHCCGTNVYGLELNIKQNGQVILDGW